MLDKAIKKDFKLRFFLSIKYDSDRWAVFRYDRTGWSWNDYRSPVYGNVQFGINGIDRQCTVFVDGKLVYKFKPNMIKIFTEITPILEMKRIVDEKDLISYNKDIRK